MIAPAATSPPTVAGPRGSQPVGRPQHGASAPRGSDQPVELGTGRFGRMFHAADPRRRLGDDAIEALLEVMHRSDGAEGSMPAGYTYLGQFIDHDVTFDPTPVSDKFTDEHARVSFRSPRLDLDSLYGAGPLDQPYLYESRDSRDRGVKLLEGVTIRDGRRQSVDDLPRNQDERALVGDPRNDENIVISQLHLLFVRFHNKVVDHVRRTEDLTGRDLFQRARQEVCWHYQWIVVHDFLRRVVGQDMTESVLRGRRCFRPGDSPYIPVEFSGAAFRFGHSLVRDSYALNARKRNVPLFAHPTIQARPQGHLGGLRAVPKELLVDWRLFFDAADGTSAQKARRIDANIAEPLWNVPAGRGEERLALPRLNLERARSLELPAGPDVATAMAPKFATELPHLQVRPLTEAELGLGGIPSRIRAKLLASVPLWYYVLREAQARGGATLGPLGGRIVAEVLIGLLGSDRGSYLRRRPDWRPHLGTGGEFTMADVVRLVQRPL